MCEFKDPNSLNYLIKLFIVVSNKFANENRYMHVRIHVHMYGYIYILDVYNKDVWDHIKTKWQFIYYIPMGLEPNNAYMYIYGTMVQGTRSVSIIIENVFSLQLWYQSRTMLQLFSLFQLFFSSEAGYIQVIVFS